MFDDANLLGRSICRADSMTGESIVEARQFFAHDVPRQSQREMLSDGIISLREGGFLLAAAPTGIGKTAAALASALEVANFYNNNPIVPRLSFSLGGSPSTESWLRRSSKLTQNSQREFHGLG